MLTRYGELEGKMSAIKRQTEYTALDSILEVRARTQSINYSNPFLQDK